jgi:8-amino-7-oxononanoate synthase
MTIFSKLERIAEERNRLIRNQGDDFLSVCFDQILSPTEALINGKRVILAGTNNYLGLTFDQDCIQSACEALKSQGTGTTGSRLANGTYESHRALEDDFRLFYNYPEAIVFSTGFQAVSGVISTLADKNDVIFLDADSHASIYDGALQSGAQVYRFRHNEPNDLKKYLQKIKVLNGNILICLEGIYSMLGDIARLADFIAIKQEYDACLLIDEAHSLGVLGDKGGGLIEEIEGARHQVDVVVGTFSKSLGSIGGFCTSRHREIEYIRYACRQYIFTASPPPSQIASVRTALKKLQNEPERRIRLWENARSLYNGLAEIGMELGPEPSPIVAVRMNSREQAMFFWQELLDRGVYVNIAFPPATPDKRPLLRCSVTAVHTKEQIQAICDAMSKIKKKS